MKSTGILRRIDDLGRVVIPKEIRKNLKIRDGESMEIFLDDENIVLSKYSTVSGISQIAQTYADAFNELIDGNILITDRDKVIAASGYLRKKYIEQTLNENIIEKILSRETYFEGNDTTISIVDDLKEDGKLVLIPIINDGDAVGAVLLILTDEQKVDEQRKMGQFIAKVLSKNA